MPTSHTPYLRIRASLESEKKAAGTTARAGNGPIFAYHHNVFPAGANRRKTCSFGEMGKEAKVRPAGRALLPAHLWNTPPKASGLCNRGLRNDFQTATCRRLRMERLHWPCRGSQPIFGQAPARQAV